MCCDILIILLYIRVTWSWHVYDCSVYDPGTYTHSSPSLSLFPHSRAALAPWAAGPGRRQWATPPSPVLRSGGRRGGQKCPKPPGLLPFYLRTLPLLCLFAKESLPFILFQNKPFPHINIILNKPLTFSRITRIISKIPIKPLPSQK